MAAARDPFDAALKDARLAEAAHLEALLKVKDARAFRLAALRDALTPHVASHPATAGLVQLAVSPGETPRLWIDLITSVVIEPGTRSFRLEQERDGAREILRESESLEEMTAQVLRVLAHRVIARERSAAGLAQFGPEGRSDRYGIGAVIYVWATGFLFGVSSLIIAAILMGYLHN